MSQVTTGTEEMYEIEPFHARLKRLRTTKGLSMKELSLRARIPVSTYREWEYGRAITGEPYVALATALEVSVNELLTGAGNERHELIAGLSQIETQIRHLRQMAEALLGSTARSTRNES